jgi:hypothetical protein
MRSIRGAFLLLEQVWNTVSSAQVLLSHWLFTFSLIFEESWSCAPMYGSITIRM